MSLGSVLVAFSGGADSALPARRGGPGARTRPGRRGDGVLGLAAAAERGPAAAFAERSGSRQLTPQTHEIERDGYRANGGDRCYFCKAELLDVLEAAARRSSGSPQSPPAPMPTTPSPGSAPGSGPRPSAVRSPRCSTPGSPRSRSASASRRWELPTWDKPAAACLSLTDRVRRRGHARTGWPGSSAPRRPSARVLDAAGTPVRNLRVRDLGDRARVEVDRRLLAAVYATTGRAACWPSYATAGFSEAELDPRGFRSGSMNELLADLSGSAEPVGRRATAPIRDAHPPSSSSRERSPVPTGKVKWYDAEKGFGFLPPTRAATSTCASDALPDGVTTLKSGTRVEFGLVQGRKGDQAIQVRVLDAAAVGARKAHAQEARGHGQHRRGPHAAAGGSEQTYRRGRHPDAEDGQADREAAARAGRRARPARPLASDAAAGDGSGRRRCARRAAPAERPQRDGPTSQAGQHGARPTPQAQLRA